MSTLRELMDGAWVVFQAGCVPEAERLYRRAIEIDPSAAEAWYLLGAIEQMRGKHVEAEENYRRALAFAPQLATARNNLGVLLLTRREPVEAAACFQEALRLQPDYADAHSNLGNALQMLGRVEESFDCYRRALELKPDHVDAHLYLGNAYQSMGRIPEALLAYDETIRLSPNYAQAHLSRAITWLVSGDFERGWAEQEWRFQLPGAPALPLDRPRWDGSPLRGRSILLYADHGLGDGLQFIRYAKWVEERGGRTILVCQRPLEKILATCAGVRKVVPEGTPITDFDVYIPLMSLPLIFKTTLATIPGKVPYLHPDAALVDRWRDELGLLDDGGFKIGIAWQGNPIHGNDHERSFRLAQFEPLTRIPGVRLISLQKGFGSEQIAELGGRFPLVDLGTRLGDLMDTAALMKNLDLVITPDTALAHLAGAIGVQAWVALPFAPDWRWLLDRDDSPWYPTIKLFRQRQRRDWNGVFARMSAELAGRVPSGKTQG